MDLHKVWQLPLPLISGDSWAMHDFLGRDIFCFPLPDPDLVHQQRWSSRWCARGCAPWIRAIVCSYLLEQQDVWWPCSPLEKHTEARNCIIHGKIQPSSNWTNIHSLWLCYVPWSFHRLRCQSNAMLRPQDNRLSKASTWHYCSNTEGDNHSVQLWGEKSGLKHCCGETRGQLWETPDCCSKKAVLVFL